MITEKIPWGDGTFDEITFTYTGTVGKSDLRAVSDPNGTLLKRQKTLALEPDDGVELDRLTVTQESRSRDYNADYNADYK